MKPSAQLQHCGEQVVEDNNTGVATARRSSSKKKKLKLLRDHTGQQQQHQHPIDIEMQDQRPSSTPSGQEKVRIAPPKNDPRWSSSMKTPSGAKKEQRIEDLSTQDSWYPAPQPQARPPVQHQHPPGSIPRDHKTQMSYRPHTTTTQIRVSSSQERHGCAPPPPPPPPQQHSQYNFYTSREHYRYAEVDQEANHAMKKHRSKSGTGNNKARNIKPGQNKFFQSSSSSSTASSGAFSRTLDALDLDWRSSSGNSNENENNDGSQMNMMNNEVPVPYNHYSAGVHYANPEQTHQRPPSPGNNNTHQRPPSPNSREHSKDSDSGHLHRRGGGNKAGGDSNKISPGGGGGDDSRSEGSHKTGTDSENKRSKSHSDGKRHHGGIRVVEEEKGFKKLTKKGKEDDWKYQMVSSRRFDIVIGFVIVVNAICMGVEYQLSDKHLEDSYFMFQVLDLTFLIVFTLELSLRLIVFGIKDIVTTPIYALDCFIVAAGMITELALPLLAGNFMSGNKPTDEDETIRLIRSCRALRALRVLRVVTLVEQLFGVVELFFYSLPPLFWTVVFIMIIIFLFTIFTIVLVGRSNMGNDPLIVEAQENFENTSVAFVYLFQIMTLDGWVDLVQPLGEGNIWTYFWFLLFISVTSFSLMNLITVAVLETARGAQAARKEAEDISSKMSAIHDLYAFPGDVGETTKDFFVSNWKNCKTFVSVFHQLNLTEADAGGFFEALDLDGSGSLDHFELSTTYMELVTNVLNTPSLVALIRSASESDERSRLLRSTMERSQAQRIAEEQKQSMEHLQETIERFQREMFELLPGMIRKELTGVSLDSGTQVMTMKNSNSNGGGPMTREILKGVAPGEAARKTNTAPDFVV